MPERIQLSRAKGWRKPVAAIVVSRPSKWGNPYLVERINGAYRCCAGYLQLVAHVTELEAREVAVQAFRRAITGGSGLVSITPREIKRELRGKDLCCWCPLTEPGKPDVCHAAVLIEIANAP